MEHFKSIPKPKHSKPTRFVSRQIDKSFTWIPIQILYIHGHFKLRNMKLHVLMIKLTHWAWAACASPSLSRPQNFLGPRDPKRIGLA